MRYSRIWVNWDNAVGKVSQLFLSLAPRLRMRRSIIALHPLLQLSYVVAAAVFRPLSWGELLSFINSAVGVPIAKSHPPNRLLGEAK